MSLPSDFPALNIDILESNAPGKIFISNTINRYLLIFENDGTPYFYKRVSNVGYDFKKQETGTTTYINGFFFVEMDSNYCLIDSLPCGSGYFTDPHELQVLENGNYLLIAHDSKYVDMSELVAGGYTNAKVKGNHIQELNRNGEVVFEWLSWDQFIRIHRGDTISIIFLWKK